MFGDGVRGDEASGELAIGDVRDDAGVHGVSCGGFARCGDTLLERGADACCWFWYGWCG